MVIDDLEKMTQDNELMLVVWQKVPVSIMKGKSHAVVELSSSHEEPDSVIVQHAIARAEGNTDAQISFVCDDTDVLALLCYFSHSRKLDCAMIMESSVHGRNAVDIHRTVQKPKDTIPQILQLHSLSGCDTVAATHGVGKPTVIATVKKGLKLDNLGHIQWSPSIMNLSRKDTPLIRTKFLAPTDFLLNFPLKKGHLSNLDKGQNFCPK